MASYAQQIGIVRNALREKGRLAEKEKRLTQQLYDSQKRLCDMLDAQRLLATVSDDNTEKTLSYITGMVNKVLAEIFHNTGEAPRITLTKKLYGGSKPHINVELIDGSGHTLDMSIQSGTGLTQVVCFMYEICLIEIRKGRRILIMDERLNGLHKEAKRILAEIIKIFAEGGFQFVFVEYGLNTLGKLYNVERRGDLSILRPVSNINEYTDETVFLGGKVDYDLLDAGYTEE